MSEKESTPIKVVGMGPFRLPGEAKRHQQAEKAARRLLELAESAKERGRQ